MTRAQERLILTTHGGRTAAKQASLFVGEILEGRGSEVRSIDRTGGKVISATACTAEELPEDDDLTSLRGRTAEAGTSRRRDIAGQAAAGPPGHAAADRARAPARAAPPGERAGRAAGGDRRRRPGGRRRPRRLRAASSPASPAPRPPRDEARRPGLDPLTFRSVALDYGRRREPAPGRAAAARRTATRRSTCTTAARSSTRSTTCTGSRAADEPVAGVHLRHDRARGVRGVHEGAPRTGRARRAAADPRGSRARRSGRAGRRRRSATRRTEEGYQRRVATLLDNFWKGEVSSLGEALHGGAGLRADARTWRRRARRSSSAARSTGSTGCRRAASRSSTTRPAAPRARRASTRASSSRSTRSPAATRWASARRSGSRCTSRSRRCGCRTTRTDEQLDAARADVLARVALMRAGDFAATPGDPCRWCDYRAMCPERAS